MVLCIYKHISIHLRIENGYECWVLLYSWCIMVKVVTMVVVFLHTVFRRMRIQVKMGFWWPRFFIAFLVHTHTHAENARSFNGCTNQTGNYATTKLTMGDEKLHRNQNQFTSFVYLRLLQLVAFFPRIEYAHTHIHTIFSQQLLAIGYESK